MATFALIHGGGGSAWEWHLVAKELRAGGHDPGAGRASGRLVGEHRVRAPGHQQPDPVVPERRAQEAGGEGFFTPDFMRGVVRDRLGVTPDEIDGGHAPMLARPKELADYLTGRS
jgi:hypothetical protein